MDRDSPKFTEVSPPLTTGNVHTWAPVLVDGLGVGQGYPKITDVAPTIGQHQRYTWSPEVVDEVAPTLNRRGGGRVRDFDAPGGLVLEVSPPLNTQNRGYTDFESGGGLIPEVAPTITSRYGRGNTEAAAKLRARSMMPVECERLMGFPDDWTNIEYRGKWAADTPRYAAIGNSMMVNVVRWIGRRIEAVEAIG